VPAEKKATRRTNAPIQRTSVDEPQWYLISEDDGLSLRIVSGAILCEGEDGELVVSPEHAAHSARFDIIEDELWLSCLTGRLRADGRLVTQHHHVTSGVQLQIGRTRYFVASEINEAAPDVPLLDNAMQPGDTHLPRPTQRHLPVFYSGPLEVEEIIITESAEVLSPPDDAGPSAAAKPLGGATPQQTNSAANRNHPAKSGQSSRGKMTALLLAGLGASISFAGWQMLATTKGQEWLVAIESGLKDAWETGRAEPGSSAAGAFDHNTTDPATINSLAWLVWTQGISEENHAGVLSLLSALDAAVPTTTVREHMEHYVHRLVTEVHDVDDLKPLVMTLGPVLARYPAYRTTLASLENRLLELSRAKPGVRDARPHAGDLRVAQATPRSAQPDVD
jgi:hypothetical protein